MDKSLLLLLLVLCCLQCALCFKWNIEEDLPYDKYFTFSERYMFGDHNGPVLMDQGSAYIKVNMDINTLSKSNRSITIGMAIYSASEGHHDSTLDGICEPGKHYPNTWADYVEIVNFPTQYDSTVELNNAFVGLNGTYFHRTASVHYHYTVQKEAWYNVVFIVCPVSGYYVETASLPLEELSVETVHLGVHSAKTSDTLLTALGVSVAAHPGALWTTAMSPSTKNEAAGHAADERTTRRLSFKKELSTTLLGTIEFHNPYGFIPAEMFGLLPFQTARMVAYTFFFVFFVGHYYQYRAAAIHLHSAFLVVFLFAMVEATLWFASYQNLNITGVPYCCPFPPLVVGSLVLQVLRQTLSRFLLLVVCLGYGIVRPKLMPAEWAAVFVMSALYLLAAFVSQGAVIFFASEAHGNFNAVNAKLTPFKIPAVVLDVIFLTWIYLAINATIRVLTEFKQTVKLSMYRQLVAIIGFFAAAFVVVTLVFMLDGMGYEFVPWQCAWLEQVIWESLNFAVLAAVCVVCRPTATSQMLAYASQLPTEDPDLDDDEEAHGSTAPPGPWSDRGRAFVYGADDEEQQPGGAYYNIGKHSSANTIAGAGGQVEMSALPTRNPISSGAAGLGKLGKGSKKTPAKDSARTLASAPTAGREKTSNGNGAAAAAAFDTLPQADEEGSEYGLDAEDWN